MQRILCTIVLLAITGCGGGSPPSAPEPKSGPQTIAELENAGQLPKLDRTDSIRGIDSDNNGIRDDIDLYIEATYTVPKERAAAKQFARAIQNTLMIDASIRKQADASAEVVDKAMSCFSAVFVDERYTIGSAMLDKIEAMTVNTKERMKKYLAYNKALDGSVIEDNSGERFCE